MNLRAANAYRRADLESAPKEQIVERLFERFLADVEAARVAITACDIKGKAAAIDHALQIVSELAAALDHRAAPALAANLGSLYDFVSQLLSEANLTMKVDPLDACTRIMEELLTAFRNRPR